MLKGLTLQELAKKIEAAQDHKRDLIADTPTLTMHVGPDMTTALEVDGQGDFPILPLAHDQIGARLGIPAKYYDRMRTDAPELLAANVDAWFRQNPERRMLRTLGGNLRAFLSNRYMRTENEEIASVVLPILFELPGVQIPSCEVTDRRLYIHFVVPGITGEVKVGDIVQAGGIISNSEVGCGAVSVSALISLGPGQRRHGASARGKRLRPRGRMGSRWRFADRATGVRMAARAGSSVNAVSGGRTSRQKGDRHERALVAVLQAAGFAAERVPLSGAARGRFGGDVSVPLLGIDRRAEVKVRGNGFRELYKWLNGADLLVVRADRAEPLVVLPLRFAIEIATAAERGRAR